MGVSPHLLYLTKLASLNQHRKDAFYTLNNDVHFTQILTTLFFQSLLATLCPCICGDGLRKYLPGDEEEVPVTVGNSTATVLNLKCLLLNTFSALFLV